MSDEYNKTKMREAIYAKANRVGIPISALTPQETVSLSDGTKIFKTEGNFMVLYREVHDGVIVKFADMNEK